MFGRVGVPSSTEVSTIHCKATREKNKEVEREKERKREIERMYVLW